MAMEINIKNYKWIVFFLMILSGNIIAQSDVKKVISPDKMFFCIGDTIVCKEYIGFRKENYFYKFYMPYDSTHDIWVLHYENGLIKEIGRFNHPKYQWLIGKPSYITRKKQGLWVYFDENGRFLTIYDHKKGSHYDPYAPP